MLSFMVNVLAEEDEQICDTLLVHHEEKGADEWEQDWEELINTLPVEESSSTDTLIKEMEKKGWVLENRGSVRVYF